LSPTPTTITFSMSFTSPRRTGALVIGTESNEYVMRAYGIPLPLPTSKAICLAIKRSGLPVTECLSVIVRKRA